MPYKPTLAATKHVTPYSGDARWIVVDDSSDHGDVVATIDPDDVFEELDRDASSYAHMFAAAPEMLAALEALTAELSKDNGQYWNRRLEDAGFQVLQAV